MIDMVLSDKLFTLNRTFPGATCIHTCVHNAYIGIKAIFIPASDVLFDATLLGSLVPLPLVAVIVTVINW